MTSTPVRIGLVAGIGGGKSTVAQMMAELGAVVLDADKIAHDQLAKPEVVQQLARRWGDGIVLEDGEVDRAAIAARVFGDAESARVEREWLESIVHPLVREAMLATIANQAASGHQAFVLDVPLLVEVGWDALCDFVVWIDTPRERRNTVAVERGWSLQELARREASQLPDEKKRASASHVLENNGDLSLLRKNVESFWRTKVEPQLREE